MKFTEIGFSEYKKLRQMLIERVEGNQESPYRDTNTKDDSGLYKGKITIGIGVNIQDNNGFWGKLVLYYLFDLTKQSNEVEFNTFYTESRLEELVTKQFTDNQSFKNAEFKKLISDIVKLYIKDVNTIHKGEIQNHFNNAIKRGIQQYITQPNKQEKINKLNDSDLKITKNTRGEIEYIELKINKKQARELFNIMIINYEAITLRHFNDKKIFDCFNAIQEKEQNNRKYYREFIPFASATYQYPYVITNKNNVSLLTESFNLKSRFLLWAILRYKLGSDSRRRILQSMVFNLTNKTAMNTENDNEKFDTCVSIFKALNLLNISNKNQTYLEYFTAIDGTMENIIANEKSTYEKRDSQRYKANSDYEFYRSTYINSNELQALRDILNPYAKYLNNIIPQAHFEKNADFGLFSLQTGQSNNSKDSNEAKQEYRFMFHNIYFIDNTNYDEVNQALMAYKNQTNANDNTTDKENILVFIIDKLNKQIQLHRPNNCYLYVVCAKGNDLDCAFCNCIMEDSTLENDECELFMLEGANSINTSTIQNNSQPQTPITITPLATKKALLLEYPNDILKQKEAIYNNFIYFIDTNNDLYIKDKNSQTILFILSNYKCHIKQSLSNQEQHNNNNNVAYILDTTLYPNKSYSTFGIKLQVKQDQDTFSNKGNFEVHINNINIKQLETQTNNIIIKDTPFFCYNQHSKQITMAKLQDNSVTIRTNMNESIKKQAKKGLINPIFINLSFYPLYNNHIANNTTSQKLQLVANDINKGSVNVTFKIPNILLNNTELIQFKKKNPQKETRDILFIKFNGKKIYIVEKGEITEEYTFQAQSGSNNNKTTMIEEGNYYIKPKEIQQFYTASRSIEVFDISNLGDRHIKLYQNTDEKVKIFLKGDIIYQRFILKLTQKIDNLKTQGYKIDKVKLEVGYKKQYLLAHSPLAELIVSKESKNNYNIANKYNPKTKNYPPTKEYQLTKMTLGEIMEKQAKKELFATGRYQIVPNTLNDAKVKLNLNENDLYNEEMQDRIFEEYLLDKKAGRSAISDYIKKNGDIEKAAYALAKEFASIGVKKGWAIADYPKGTKRTSNGKQSYYEDIGGNKMLITYEKIIQALKDTKEQGGY